MQAFCGRFFKVNMVPYIGGGLKVWIICGGFFLALASDDL
jgi:hypothetical protein